MASSRTAESRPEPVAVGQGSAMNGRSQVASGSGRSIFDPPEAAGRYLSAGCPDSSSDTSMPPEKKVASRRQVTSC